MAAILSDDCVVSTEATKEATKEAIDEKPVHISVTQAPCPVVPATTQEPDVPTGASQSSLPQFVPAAAPVEPPPDTARIEPTYVAVANPFTVSQSCFTAQPKATTAFPSAYASRSPNSPMLVAVVPPGVPDNDGYVPAGIGRHTCPYCKLVCNKPSVLQKHIRAHTNERPFPCHPCGFAFKTRSNLYKHRRSRSHSLKLEEAGVDCKAYAFEEDVCEEDEDSQTPKDVDSGTDDGKVEHPKTSIYKPKFHKAAIYIQNIATNATGGAESCPIPTTTTLTTGQSAVGLNKFGLQLVIPATVPSSSRLTPSPFSGSSPSPEFLQRHINKLINENQAIVETTDPFWSKKFCQRGKEGSSLPSSPLPPLACNSYSYVDSNSPQKKRAIADGADEKVLPAESKLAHALLQPKVAKSGGVSEGAAEEAQPLNLSISKDVGKSRVLEVVHETVASEDVKHRTELMAKSVQVSWKV